MEREEKGGGPDSTGEPKLVCPKWWVWTSAGFCNDSKNFSVVCMQVQLLWGCSVPGPMWCVTDLLFFTV